MSDIEWIEWAGGDCPVAGDTRVDVRLRDGSEYRRNVGVLEWDHISDDSDIVAYRVLS